MQDGTYDKDRKPVTHADGFQVGLWTTTTNAENIENVIKTITRTWSGEWGIWTDSDTGEVSVEPCVWFAVLHIALEFGQQHNQKAIWSWAEMKEIEV